MLYQQGFLRLPIVKICEKKTKYSARQDHFPQPTETRPVNHMKTQASLMPGLPLKPTRAQTSSRSDN